MSSDPAVCFRQVTKCFHHGGPAAWRSALPIGHGGPVGPPVIDDVSFEVRPGEAVAIIGANGAGKSTILKLLAGVLQPTSGRIDVRGRIGAMIELGLGFQPLLTGRENAEVMAAVHGLTPTEVRRRLPDIVEFAGLGSAIDLPLREYSSGMVARLGFAVAVHVDAEVLVVDEVLAVGDRDFQENCLRRMGDLVAEGAALLFVSHEMPLVRSVCGRAMVLAEGRVVEDALVSVAVDRYLGRRTAPPAVEAEAARIRSLAVTPSIAPHDRVEVDAVFDLFETTAAHSIQVALTLPTLDPDLVLAECRTSIDHLQPGSYRVRATSTPVPLIGGRLGLSFAVLTAGRAALASAIEEFQVQGPLRTIKPMYDPRTTMELTRLDHAPIAEVPVPGSAPKDPVLRVDGLSKSFRQRLGSSSGRGRGGERVLALHAVDLRVGRGEAVGLIGPNGAGKSTLLRCIAGLHRLDAGSSHVAGRLVPMLELGVGFRGDFDGWDNLRATMQMLSVEDELIEELLPEVVEMAGVADAMGEPVKYWSTGMRARLGFSLATSIPADLYLIDEMLAVGDEEFRRVAVDRVMDLVAGGASILLVSHEMRLITEVCERAVRLERGVVVDDGPVDDVVERYGGTGWAGGRSIGSGPVRIRDAQLDRQHVTRGGRARFHALVEVGEPAPHVRLELSLRDPGGMHMGTDLTIEAIELISLSMERAAPAGALAEPGWYQFTAVTGDLLGSGEVHMVLAAIDVRDNSYLAEAWAVLHVGGGIQRTSDLPGAFSFDVDMSIDRVG